jgi:hypothetical protein
MLKQDGPKDAVIAGQDLTGVYVLDMADPSHPGGPTSVDPASPLRYVKAGLRARAQRTLVHGRKQRLLFAEAH